MGEEWRTYSRNPRYEVSNQGRVRHVETKRVRKAWTNELGYRYFSLAIENRKSKRVPAHRMVAETWIPNPKDLPVVRHWNDTPGDDRVENLRWGDDERQLV